MSLVISVVMPAFNESRTIIESVTRCLATLDSLSVPYELIVVDDGSQDDTVDLLNTLENRHLRVVKNFKNQGKGASIINGWKETSGDYVCFLDADLDIDCRGLSHFYSRITAADLPVDIVIGSKMHKDSRVSYPFTRRVQSQIFKLIVRIVFGLKIQDTQTGLKMFKRKVLQDCLPFVATHGFAFDLELLVIAHEKDFSVIEEPVNVNFNFTSSVKLTSAVTMAFDVMKIKRKSMIRTTNYQQ
jgi:glycosyltransferase involved in cell wall biosynthesis